MADYMEFMIDLEQRYRSTILKDLQNITKAWGATSSPPLSTTSAEKIVCIRCQKFMNWIDTIGSLKSMKEPPSPPCHQTKLSREKASTLPRWRRYHVSILNIRAYTKTENAKKPFILNVYSNA